MGCAVSRLDDKNRPPITILLTRFQRDISQHLVGSSRRSNVELTVDQCESDSDTSETRLNINVYDANTSPIEHQRHAPSIAQLVDGIRGGGSPAPFRTLEDDQASHMGEEVPPQNLQYICGTEVSFEWLFRKLIERFKCNEEPEPQWIVEKMNVFAGKDLDKTMVLKVTFGWENAKLPRSVVLKICDRHEEDFPEEADELASKLFWRECHTYEWLSKHKWISVPRVYVIKKLPSETSNALIVMEDLSERSQIGELNDGIDVEGVRDLLRIMAQVHALSMWKRDWTAFISDHSPYFYEQSAIFMQNVAAQWIPLGDSRYSGMASLLSANYLLKMTSEGGPELGLKQNCLVHGNLAARNVFLTTGQKKVAAVIDWTQVHPGCYGEDIAKAICWNLTPGVRRAHLTKLLQFYHYNLLKKYKFYAGGERNERSEKEEKVAESRESIKERTDRSNSEERTKLAEAKESELPNELYITLEEVRIAYNKYVPLAALQYLMFLPEDVNRIDVILLGRVKALLEDTFSLRSDDTLLGNDDNDH